jgi:hypothetical protein
MAKKLNLKALPDLLGVGLAKAGRFKVIIFVILLAAVYGLIVLRISSFDNAQPSATALAGASVPIATTHIDPTVVKQLQSLQNNSVSVQTLFEQARSNPFQE